MGGTRARLGRRVPGERGEAPPVRKVRAPAGTENGSPDGARARSTGGAAPGVRCTRGAVEKTGGARMTPMKRLEFVIDAVELSAVCDVLEQAGVTGYTVIREVT